MDIALFGGFEDVARSVPEDGHQLIAAFGGITCDLSRLELPESLHMSALAAFGGIDLMVPAGTDVVLRGFAMFGGRDVQRRATAPVRSTIYLNAVALFGGIRVTETDE